MIAIGTAARQSGVSIETIRYYEREGIIPAIGRTSSGRRVFSEPEIAQLRFIKRCRDLGFSIQDARTLRAFSDSPAKVCRDVEDMARGHLETVRAKITDLQKLDRALTELVKNCSTGATDCPLLRGLMAG